METDDLISRNPGHLSEELDGLAVMLSIERGEYYTMNEVGTRIWQLLETPRTVPQLVEQLCAEFQIEPAACDGKVRAFLAECRRCDLVRTLARP